AIAPLSLGAGALLQYVAFDYLWWVLIAYLMIRLLKSEDPRWWLAIGATMGLGMQTKYTIGYLVLGVVGGVLLTNARRYLKSPWLWGGVALSILIFLPNLIWQAQHNFISLDFLGSIHARDVRIGRTSEFLIDQFKTCANPATIPIWIAGLYFYFKTPAGKRYRPIGWMYVIPLVLFIVTQGRGYYLAPAYPMLLAGGSVWIEQWLTTQSIERNRSVKSTIGWALAIGGLIAAAIALPVAPINSFWWDIASNMNGDLREEIGWPELVQTVAQIRDGLPSADRAQLGILAGNYGEAGAINLYGPTYKLPTAISGINSYWLRGYGDPPPQTLIVLGLTRADVSQIFQTCELAGHITNPYDVKNEETTNHQEIFVCRELRSTWPAFWQRFKYYG
ncbi:MAG TPA: glycosyltransferase family 39 protein, partial [Anaerolineae bacterium]|nr:glycosyltransferase family 39 protein [Anaerolineae bacterium]